jgi:DNA-binding NarL/FixJ family response regulator
MKIAVVSPIRIFRECIAASLFDLDPCSELTTLAALSGLSDQAPGIAADVALIDVTQGYQLDEVAALAARWTGLCLIALGLHEQREEVLRHGRAGFVAYISRDASIADLQNAILEALAGRLNCSAEISHWLIRGLFGRHRPPEPPALEPKLTGREADVLHLIGRGFSNKEIARDLGLSVATVKQHVHNVLGKLGVAQRAQAMRRVREDPWVGR